MTPTVHPHPSAPQPPPAPAVPPSPRPVAEPPGPARPAGRPKRAVHGLLALLVIAFYALHQDVWNWREARPFVFGFIPIGLAYHAAYSVAAALLMALLVRCAWPAHLESAAGHSHPDAKPLAGPAAAPAPAPATGLSAIPGPSRTAQDTEVRR